MTVLTTRPARLAAGLLLAGGFTAGYIAVGVGIASAHKAAVAMTESVCHSGDWSFDLSISSDVPGGASTISAFSSPYTVNLPYGPVTVHVAADQDHYTFTVRTVWPDGFQSPEKDLPPASYSVARPVSGCVTPTTTTVPPVTSSTTIAPPPETSTPPTTICATPVTLEDGGQVCNDTYGAPPATTPVSPVTTDRVQQKITPTTTVAPALPATGSNDTTILVVGVAALLLGGILLLAGRRGSAA